MSGLSDRELRRYARHLTLPGFGAGAQQTLRNSRVLVIGAGGLGAPVLQYLTAAGVGQITIIDDDVVDESNLQRQVIHRETDVGRPKAQSARDAVLRLDSHLSVTAVVERLNVDNALELFADHDVVLDGADNFATRYLSNDAAELTNTPLVWATILQYSAQISVFWPGKGPMLRDLYPDIPDPGSVPSCAAGGVLGAMVGQVGSMMAIEAIKVLTEVGTPLVGRLMLVDALTASVKTLSFDKDPNREPVDGLSKISQVCAASWDEDAAANEVQLREVGPHAAAALLEDNADVSGPRSVLFDVREVSEHESSRIPHAISVPLGHIESKGWQALREASALELEQTQRVIVHCQTGRRSSRAAEILLAAQDCPVGVEILNLEGGIVAWQAAGLGVDT